MHIRIYGTPNCQSCKTTQNLIAKRGLEYDYIDLSTDFESAQMLKAAGHRELPVVIVNSRNSSKTWTGFRASEISLLPWLDKNGKIRYIDKRDGAH